MIWGVIGEGFQMGQDGEMPAYPVCPVDQFENPSLSVLQFYNSRKESYYKSIAYQELSQA
jgi:hypothetical protein